MKFPKITQSDFFYLLFIFFVFISTTTLSISKIEEKKKETFLLQQEITKQYPPQPSLKEASKTFPIISAQAALAIDLTSMTPLYEKNPDVSLLPASTTKIVTALVAMDYYPEDAVIIIDGLKVEGQRMGLYRNEKITVGNLLDALLIFSANDAAEVLANNYPGGRENFINTMNNKAGEYHLQNTHFSNPSGFDGGNHYSTARDLIRIAMVAMENPDFASRVRQKEKLVTSIDGSIKHKLINTNKLLGEIEGVLGVKTGWTENARENLITYMEKDGKKIMIALLGSQDRFGETKEIIKWIFENYEWKEVKISQFN